MSAKQTGMLIATLFLAREIAHREHLKQTGAGSDARHRALGSFYEAIIPLADHLAEVYQGRYGVLLDIPLVSHDGAEMSALETIQAQCDWIREMRYEAIARTETPLQNIIDEIEALYCSTIYKLKFLA